MTINLAQKKISLLATIFLILAMTAGWDCNDQTIRLTEKNLPRQPLFHYQLQNAQYTALKQLDVKYLIIDHDDSQLTPAAIADLKNGGKKVLAYLSIGEAEDYRDYWQSFWQPNYPSFIDQENPDWPGNYRVKYWESEWQKIILAKTRKIVEQGYSGIYLDLIDVYEYYAERERASAALEMIDFVKLIKETGQQTNSQLLIVPQNAPELYAFTEYQKIVDGFGQEDTWYNDNQKSSSEETSQILKYLDKALGDGKFILAIDYPTEQDKICEFYRQCTEHRFTCTVSNRELDRESPVTCSLK